MAEIDPALLHPKDLAYLGDAVYELHVRGSLMGLKLNSRQRHGKAVARVRSEAQAAALRALEPVLSDTERDIVRRARNIRPPGARGVDQVAYRHATAFEALIGYLYAGGHSARLAELLAIAQGDG